MMGTVLSPEGAVVCNEEEILSYHQKSNARFNYFADTFLVESCWCCRWKQESGGTLPWLFSARSPAPISRNMSIYLTVSATPDQERESLLINERRDSVALASNDSTAKAESPSQQPGFDGIIAPVTYC